MPVLLDEGLAVTKAYGITNEKSGKVPHPTVVVIDAEGVVRWVHLDEDYRRRPTPDTVLDAVREAQSMASGDQASGDD
jgi:peroxiredoxin